MKKVLLFSLALVATAAISSCAKDRICTCDVEQTGEFAASISADTTFTNVSKADAETKCEALNFSIAIGEESITSTCELK